MALRRAHGDVAIGVRLTPLFCLALLALVASAARAQASPVPPAIVDHEAVRVSGVVPGPGLWRVRKDGHVMSVMATLSPLPRRMRWEAAGVESALASSTQVLLPPSFTLDPGVGMMRGLLLVPSALKARRNPDGATLQQSLPPGLYARWLPLKRRYLGNDRGVEQRRPLVAAHELYEAALRSEGLSQDDPVDKAVRRMARRHGVPLRAVNLRLELDDAKAALRELRETPLEDRECFARTLDRIETDLAWMRQRANAWAEGDVATLQALPYEGQARACLRALTDSTLARRLGAGDLPARLRAMWLDAAEDVLREHATSVAVLPLSLVVAPDGYLAALQARGYEVEPP